MRCSVERSKLIGSEYSATTIGSLTDDATRGLRSGSAFNVYLMTVYSMTPTVVSTKVGINIVVSYTHFGVQGMYEFERLEASPIFLRISIVFIPNFFPKYREIR